MTQKEDSILSRLDWVELVPENFIGRGGERRRSLLQIAEHFPVTLHGVTLSIGGTDPLDWNYLVQLKELAQETRARWVTDHLCFSSVQGVQLHDLLPLPFTKEAVRLVVERVKRVQDFLEVPFGLENPSYYVSLPGAEMTEAQFISEILERADCFLLLDVNNVYVNSFNHSKNPMKAARSFFRQIPLERVIEVHIAGHSQIQLGGQHKLLDTHGAPVPDPVRLLLRELHERIPVKTLLLEREREVPPLGEVIGEVSDLWQMIWNFPEVPLHLSSSLKEALN